MNDINKLKLLEKQYKVVRYFYSKLDSHSFAPIIIIEFINGEKKNITHNFTDDDDEVIERCEKTIKNHINNLRIEKLNRILNN